MDGTDSQMTPASNSDEDATPPPVSEGGWLTVSEASGTGTSSGGGLLGPLRRGLGRLTASWRYLADPAERHALVQQMRGGLARLTHSFQRPSMAASMDVAAPPTVLPSDKSEPDEVPPFDPEAALARLRSALRQLPDKGEVIVPGNLQSLDRLLAEPPPAMDFEAADLLHDCFPRGTRHSGNRVLLAVARNLTRNFGRPGRLPMTSGKSWTMLDPAVFVDQMAAQLAEISDFVLTWQAQEKSFLILEFAEVELIEYLFEHLHPRRHGALLIQVMDFKVLSTRRAGLLRRIPARVRRFVQHTAGADPSVPLAYARDTAKLLELMEQRVFFRPVVEAAAAARAEVEKVIERLAPPAPGQPSLSLAPGGRPAEAGSGLGQIMQAVGPNAPPAARPAPPPPASATPAAMVSAAPAPSPPTQAVSVVAPPRPAGLPVPTVPQRKRFSNRVKTEAVMRVLAGESREQVAAALGATPDLLERWLDSFLNGGAAALAPKAKAQAAKPARSSRSKGPAPVEAASIDDLKAKLQSLLQTVEVLSTQIHALPAEDKAPPPALPPPAAPRPAVAPAPRSDGTASPPPGFPAEDPDPPPRLKRSRTPRPRG
ncbi:Alanine and proline-rich secreted protein apa precursor [Paramagnetospirillum magneticum AMB-1]|uniref:Alanine and proline-rich secreted protein apa n=2 Tax=Paramagnetospirillum magneticum TaxID=84159 RepID=Q2W1M6_PARM1|nr:Alanine and proline-rich secreted protein apa precursor [Paramagnetospirillum magneticum AMB-1]